MVDRLKALYWIDAAVKWTGREICAFEEKSAGDLTAAEACLYTTTCRRNAAAQKTLVAVAASYQDAVHPTVRPLGRNARQAV
jgi:hypothetical protein